MENFNSVISHIYYVKTLVGYSRNSLQQLPNVLLIAIFVKTNSRKQENSNGLISSVINANMRGKINPTLYWSHNIALTQDT